VRDALRTRIVSLCRPARGPAWAKGAPAPLALLPLATSGPAPRVEAVVLGISTGGPRALASVLPALPASLPVPVIVVQHMPPSFTRLLAQKLDRECQMRCVEAQEGMPLAPGRIYLAPGDRHLVVRSAAGRPVAGLVDGPLESSCRPAADPLFRSAAAVYGRSVLALVMTGMGADGAEGARAVRAVGGQVWAQDEATSAVWGMPGAVVRAGLAHRVLAVEVLAREITATAQRRVAPTKGRGDS
jgi:two-component system chemotaxis response regulator CheB